jgi:hypothetical protein
VLGIVLDTMDKEPAVAVVLNGKTSSHRIRRKLAQSMGLTNVRLDRVFLYPLSPDCPDVVNAVIST